jgi:hypothetical protein
MNRPTLFLLTVMALVGVAIAASPQSAFAQSDPFTGLWQINLAKAKLAQPPKSQTLSIQGEGENRSVTVVGITAQGNPQAFAFKEIIEDGKPHPVTGIGAIDAQAYTRGDARTINVTRLKDGKVVQTGTWVVSPDGKTLTATYTGTNANGQQLTNMFVYDKQ